MLRRYAVQMALAVCIWAAAIQGAQAQAFLGNESLSYSGSWKQYSDTSLTTQVASGAVFSTDLMAYLSTNSNVAGAPPGSNGTVLQTITYVTNAGTNGPTSGNYVGNVLSAYTLTGEATNKVLYNPTTNTWSVEATGMTSSGLSIFNPVLDAANTTPKYGTFAAAQGEWLSFAFGANITGSSPGVPDAFGTYTIDQINTTSANGYFTGVFQNTGDSSIYVVDLSIDFIGPSGNVARNFGTNAGAGAAAAGFLGPLDGFQGMTPEPASCLTFAMVLGASAVYGWRRRVRRADA